MVFGPPKRDDVIRKTEIARKINPENCDYMRLGQQNVWFQWVFIKEGESVVNKNTLEDVDFTITLKASQITSMGTKAAHLIDHYNFKSDPEHHRYVQNVNTTADDTYYGRSSEDKDVNS